MKRTVLWLVASAGLAAGVAVVVAVIAWVRFNEPGPLAQAATVVIARGAGMGQIAEQLVDAGVLDEPWTFRLGVTAAGGDRVLRAGEYRFPPAISPRGVIDLLASGRTVVHRLTVAEGLTTAQVVALVRQIDALEGEISATPGEGALLPETYFFSRGDQRSAIIDRQRKAMDDALSQLWSERAPGLPFKSPHEALIVASIVEKETSIAAERPRVAAVFINRLKKGMRLQADPTVVYGLADGKGAFDRPLSRADLETRHRWNTYVIDGLPPTPIANPGRGALEATLKPAESDELYFVADGSGGHVFAKTLAEHNRNVARLRAVERSRGGNGQ